MSGTLLFIHGTGVRQAGYYETMRCIAAGLKDVKRDDIRLEGFLWGDPLGVKFDRADVDAVLPTAVAKAIEDEPEWEAALWEQLLRDPLFELRMAAIREGSRDDEAGFAAPLPVADDPPDVVVTGRVTALAGKLSDPLPGGVTASVVATAAIALATQPILAEAAGAAPSVDDPDLNRAIARAIVADALNRSRGELGTGPEALYAIEPRRALVNEVFVLLVPATKGLGGWLWNKVKGAAEAWGTHYGTQRRDGLMVGAGPGIGDIILYQRRGTVILDAIEAAILRHAADGPVVALGHSLGGIMLVDLLSRPRPAGPLPVAKLITVGSQSPAFYECDALETIRKGGGLAAGLPFTPWLNVYDRNDFLSFCASRCFPGTPAGIEDFEIKSGVSFPDSHSAYFRQPAFYDKIVQDWP